MKSELKMRDKQRPAAKSSKSLLGGAVVLGGLSAVAGLAWLLSPSSEAQSGESRADARAAGRPTERARPAKPKPTPAELEQAERRYLAAVSRGPQDDYIQKRFTTPVIIHQPPVPRDPDEPRRDLKVSPAPPPGPVTIDQVAEMTLEDQERQAAAIRAGATPEQLAAMEEQERRRELARQPRRVPADANHRKDD